MQDNQTNSVDLRLEWVRHDAVICKCAVSLDTCNDGYVLSTFMQTAALDQVSKASAMETRKTASSCTYIYICIMCNCWRCDLYVYISRTKMDFSKKLFAHEDAKTIFMPAIHWWLECLVVEFRTKQTGWVRCWYCTVPSPRDTENDSGTRQWSRALDIFCP